MNRLRACLGLLCLNAAAAGALLVCSIASAQNANDWAQYSELANQYHRLQQSGDWDAAAAHAVKTRDFVLQRFPQRLHFLAYSQLADARRMQGRYNDALVLNTATLDLLQGFQAQDSRERLLADVAGNAYEGMAANLHDLGRYEEALAFYQKAVQWWDRSTSPIAAGSAAQNRVSLGNLYSDLDEFDQALEQYRAAVPLVEKLARQGQFAGHYQRLLALSLRSWGLVYRRMGRFDLAEPKVRRALGLIVSLNGWNHPQTGDILDELGTLLAAQGRWDEAGPYYRAAASAYENTVGKDHPRAIGPRVDVARVLRNQGRYEEAEQELRRVLAICEVAFGASHPNTANALTSLSTTLYLQGKSAAAEPLLRRSLEIEETAERLDVLAANINAQGRRSEALELLDRALSISEEQPVSAGRLSSVHLTRAMALWGLQRREEAVEAANQALRQAEIQRGYSSGAERERAELLGQSSHLFDAMSDWQAELGNVAELFQVVEQKKSRSFLDELRLQNVDILAGLPAAERQRLNQRTDELRRRLSAAEKKYEALSNLGEDPSADAKARRKAAVEAIFAARDALYQHLVDVRTASPIYRDLGTAKTELASLAQVQGLLGDEELMLAYSVGRYHSYVLVIDGKTAHFTRLQVDETTSKTLGADPGPLTAEKLSKVLLDEERGVLPILSSPKRIDKDMFDRLAALWQVLVPQDERAALADGRVKRVTLIPDGPLALMPLEALVVSNEGEPQYLLDVGPPIAYAPSASVLLNLANRATKDSAKQRLFTLGEPVYGQPVTAQDAVEQRLGVRGADDRFRAGLSRLPYTGWESTWIQQLFDNACLTTTKVMGAAATEAAIRQQAPGREIVHLACHGMADQSYGNFFGSLAVAPGRANDPNDDGFLTMAEIYDRDLTGCELAILSACETNYGPQQKGEGVWALSRGFLVAGARRVVASNWVVDDQAGATLVSYFASYLTKAGTDSSARDYAAALHNAKKLVHKEDKWSHPFCWSSLVLVGPK